jgi:hypothetical protein
MSVWNILQQSAQFQNETTPLPLSLVHIASNRISQYTQLEKWINGSTLSNHKGFTKPLEPAVANIPGLQSRVTVAYIFISKPI